MPKIVPAITTLTYFIPNGVSYIDLARDLSRVNRRMYRQGRNYAIESITITTAVGMQVTDVIQQVWSSTGNSYSVHEAWEKGFDAWRDQLNQHSTSTQRGKWNDFKIYLDDSMEDGTINDVVAGDGAAVSAGEWEYSKLAFDDDGTERIFKMHMIGSSNLTDTNLESGIALIEEWADARPTAQESPPMPGSFSNTIWAKLKGTDEITDLIVDTIEGENDQSPYHATDYYGGSTNGDAAQLERLIACSANEVVTTVPGFVAPCGLLRVSSEEIQLDGATPSVYEVTAAPTTIAVVRLVPGPYKGVLAPPMGQ